MASVEDALRSHGYRRDKGGREDGHRQDAAARRALDAPGPRTAGAAAQVRSRSLDVGLEPATCSR
jgi:hypothetical protein